jgi:hypothetical protein
MCWYAYGEPYVPYDTMVERMVGSNSSSTNVHGVIDDNSNHHRNIVMDTMRINQGHVTRSKSLMSYPKCRSVEVINNPARPGSNHREVNYIKL